jgi:hypothetical protein
LAYSGHSTTASARPSAEAASHASASVR